MTRRAFRVALIGGLVAGSAWAKVDFSGSWKLDRAKSDFGNLPMPAAFDRIIEQTSGTIHMRTRQSGQQGLVLTDITFTTDGKENTVRLSKRDGKVTAHWEANDLVVETKSEIPQGTMVLTERWTLDQGYAGLTIEAKVQTPMGDTPFRVHLIKQ